MSWVLLAVVAVIGFLGGMMVTPRLYSLVLVAIALGMVIARQPDG